MFFSHSRDLEDSHGAAAADRGMMRALARWSDGAAVLPGTVLDLGAEVTHLSSGEQEVNRSILSLIMIAALMPSVVLGDDEGAPAEAKPTPVVDFQMLEDYRVGALFQGDLDSARFSSDGRRLVTVSAKLIRVWDAVFGRLIATIDAEPGGSVPIVDAAFLARGRWVVTCGPWMQLTSSGRDTATAGGVVRVFDCEFRDEIFRFAHLQNLASISVSSNGRYMTCFTTSSRLIVLDTTKDRKVSVKAEMELTPSDPTSLRSSGHALGDEADIAADGLRAVVILPGTKAAGGLILYDVARESVRTVTVGELAKAASHVPENPGQLGVRKVALSPDGRKLALVFSESRNSAQVLDFDSLEHAGTFALEPGQEVERLMFAPDSRLAVVSMSGRVTIFDTDKRRRISDCNGLAGQPIRAMRFVDDDLRILSGAGKEARSQLRNPPPPPPPPRPPLLDAPPDPTRLYLWKIRAR
ncbi:MAG: hypothetical protein SFX72_03010 [Isosphaeraceae bacterium]|nr:hypothetical protein [Isosphaeraceae bacterium]